MNAVQDAAEKMVLRLISRRPADWTYESALAAVKGFAALVAAHERDRMTVNSIHTCHAECDRPGCVRVREAVKAERERICAIVYGNCASDNEAERIVRAIRGEERAETGIPARIGEGDPEVSTPEGYHAELLRDVRDAWRRMDPAWCALHGVEQLDDEEADEILGRVEDAVDEVEHGTAA